MVLPAYICIEACHIVSAGELTQHPRGIGHRLQKVRTVVVHIRIAVRIAAVIFRYFRRSERWSAARGIVEERLVVEGHIFAGAQILRKPDRHLHSGLNSETDVLLGDLAPFGYNRENAVPGLRAIEDSGIDVLQQGDALYLLRLEIVYVAWLSVYQHEDITDTIKVQSRQETRPIG